MDRNDRRTQAQLLSPGNANGIVVGRTAPPAGLRWSIDYLWWVEWNEPQPRTQAIIPRPVVHLAAETWEGEPRLMITGVQTRRFERRLAGAGRTVGAAFRPAGFSSFIAGPVATLTDRVVPAGEVLGIDDRMVAAQLLDPLVPLDQAAGALASWLASIRPTHDPLAAELAQLIETVEADESIVQVSQLADLAGVSPRTLQRQFRSRIGVGPKAVIQRLRLLDAARAANSGTKVDWPAVATRLGYADQSHLIRHFTDMVGEPPARYIESSSES